MDLYYKFYNYIRADSSRISTTYRPFEEIGSSVGRAHNWDAGDCRFESHEIQPGDFSTAMQTDMPDIECRIMSSVSPTPHSAVGRSEQWLDLCSRPSDEDVKLRS